MSVPCIIQPRLMGRLNERQVLHTLQIGGPLSRAEVARHLGLSAPTVSKAVATLLDAGLLEEFEALEVVRGRPAKRLRVSRDSSQVFGVSIGTETCEIIAAGLDGQLDPARQITIQTPADYNALLQELLLAIRKIQAEVPAQPLGIGISLPGLIDYAEQKGLLSPNLPLTNNQTPGLDLTRELDLPAVLIQESHALCLAEQHYGAARGLQNFAIMDVGNGIGLGIVSGGRIVTGQRGLAGEIGHIPVAGLSRRCGCGNLGCLETEASEGALAWRVGQRLQRTVTPDEAVQLVISEPSRFEPDLHETLRQLAIGIAAVINLFNPSRLFLHGRMLAAIPDSFQTMIEYARARTLLPAWEECQIQATDSTKHQGAIAGIIQHLTAAHAPTLETRGLFAAAQ